MKKFFASLMLGFGATLGVFVALAMPPGGWGVAVGVGLGLLGCLPILLIVMMLAGRGSLDRRTTYYAEDYEPQPVIIIQPPAIPAYEGPVFQDAYGNYVYAEASEYYPYSDPRLARPAHEEPAGQRRRLPSRRRQAVEPAYYPEEAAYYPPPDYRPAAPGQRYYEHGLPEDYDYYYDTPPPRPEEYDAYYGPSQALTARPSGYERPSGGASRSRPARRTPPARHSGGGDVVEAEYRTIGDK